MNGEAMNPSLVPVRLILVILLVAAAFVLRLLATAIRHLDPKTRALAAERSSGRAPKANGADEPRILGVLERFVRAASDLEAGALLALAMAAGLAATAFPTALGLGITIAAAFALTPFFLGVLPERTAAGRVAAVLARATPAILLLAAVFHPLTILRDIFAFPIERLLSIRLGRSVHGVAVTAATADTAPAALGAEPAPVATPAGAGQAGTGSGSGFHQVLDFTRATVNEVMTPRSEMVAVESGATLGDLTEIVRTTRHGSYPIYRTTLEDLAGKVSLIDVLGEIDPNAAVDAFRQEVTVVPESKRVIELAPDMRQKSLGLVMVVDEFGSVSGVANLHDLMKALVGEIAQDPADEGEDGNFEARRLDLHTWVLNPRTRIERMNEILGVAIPEGDYQTLGGFILDQMGRIPLPREHLRFADGEFEILAADERHILSVRFRRLVPGART